MKNEEMQLNLFDQDLCYGKMSWVCSPPNRAKISRRSWKKRVKLLTAPYLYLDLREGYGNLLGAFWEENSALLGEYWMLNTGVSPKEEIECFLWQILEDIPHQKYYLSKTACLGILRRAENRGKELPKQLQDALLIQSGQVIEVQIVDDEFKSYHINQRNEGIDLDGLSGALLATQNIQMQTFVKEPLYCLSDQGGERMNITKNMVGTLRASMGGHLPIIKQELYENHAKDARYTGPLDVAPTISAIYGTGGNNTPFVAEPIAFGIEATINETDTSHTLDTANPNPNKSQGGLAIVQESYCIAANTINRDVKNGGNGLGVQNDISYTLTTADVHSVYKPEPYQDVVGAICATDDKGPNNQYVGANKCIVDHQQVFGQSSYGGYGDEVSTLCACGGYLGGGSENLSVSRNLVRRLTPLECERLQGFPDNWTNIDGAADSPRYKALGNSIAIPCAEYIMQGIALALNGGDICV